MYKPLTADSAWFAHLLHERLPEKHVLLHCYYGSDQPQDQRSANAIIRNLLAQLYRIIGEVPPDLSRLYQEHRSSRAFSHLSDGSMDDRIHALIQAAIAQLRSTTIIIDALDECSDPQEVALSIFRIVDSANIDGADNVRVLVTSRDKIKPLETTLKKKDYVKVLDLQEKQSEIKGEIDAYVDARLQDMISKEKLNIQIDAEFVTEIAATVKETSNSMWVFVICCTGVRSC